MYILKCSDGSYYTGSTNDLERRLEQHQNGEGANHTKKHLPVKLLYYEEYQRIDEAFYREKQVQGWSRKKKEALINGNAALLPQLAIAYRDLANGGFENLNHRKKSDNNDLENINNRNKSAPENGGFENLNHRKENLNHRKKVLEENTPRVPEDKNSQGLEENTPKVPEALEGTVHKNGTTNE